MKKFLSLSFLLFVSLTVFPQDWKSLWTGDQFSQDSRWISMQTNAGDENQWIIFRKKYVLDDLPREPLAAKIAVDSKYWLYLNGQPVVFEGQLKRGPTPADTYYNEVDISPYLQPGENTIAVLVWFWGRDGYCHNNSGKAGLFFEAVNPEISWVSNNSWKYAHHIAFGATGDPQPNHRLAEFNIRYTAGPELEHWMAPGFDDTLWARAVEIGPAGSPPWNELWKRPFPQWKNSGIVSYSNKLEMPFISEGNAIRMKLPVNYSITPWLKVDAPEAGSVIDIRTDNYRGGSAYNVRTEYITRKGEQEFETYGYMNGHEVIYSIPAGIKVLGLGYRRTSFPTEHTGSFQCDDPFLNSLWQKSLNTMDLNMRDAIQDPDRERSQYWGDAVIVAGEILCSCDSNGVSVIKKAISNLVEWQREDGSLYAPVPTGKWLKELPQQMLASIGKYGFWNYFRYTGDTAMVRYVYPHVVRYLALWQLGADGLVEHRPGLEEKKGKEKLFWEWTDWGDNIDALLCENAWYYMALESAANLSKILGYPAEAARYEKQMQRLKTAFNKLCWTGKAYRSPSWTGSVDDRGNGLAVVAGLADTDKWPHIRALFDTAFHAGPYLEKYILESYFIMNDARKGIQRMKKRYRMMVESPLTTLWEGWEVGSHTHGGGSYNHGWSGGPLILMSQYLAGIQPGDDGFQRVLVKPQMGDLRWIECTVPHKKGIIRIQLKEGSGVLHGRITLPAGLTGTLVWNNQNRNLHEGFQEVKMK
jgi:hypothetical protein